MSPTTELLGLGEGRGGRRDSKAQGCLRNLISRRMGGSTEVLGHGPLVIICGSPATCTPNMVSRRVWWVRHTPGTGTLLCVIGSVCGFTFSDEV